MSRFRQNATVARTTGGAVTNQSPPPGAFNRTLRQGLSIFSEFRRSVLRRFGRRMGLRPAGFWPE